MLFSLPGGRPRRPGQQAVGDRGHEGARAGADAGRDRGPVSSTRPAACPRCVILGLLGVQAALFSPAKYGILPEILPHERLSAGNGLLEMWTNLAIIAGTVAGGRDRLADRGPALARGPDPRRCSRPSGLVAALARPAGPAARSEGGLVDDGAASPGRRSGPTASSGWRSAARSSSGRSPAWSRRRS